MAHEGQEVEGPNGFRLRFVRISDDLLEMEARYRDQPVLVTPSDAPPRPDS